MKKILIILALCSSNLIWAQSGNTFQGSGAGASNTTGQYNTFFGDITGSTNTTGNYNTFFGSQSGYNNNGGFNSFLGYRSGFNNTTGNRNTFFGTSTGYDNTTGVKNTFIGDRSGANVTSGKQNVFVGSESGFKNKTGQNNTFIGNRSGYNNLGTANVFIGAFAGFNETGSNKLYIDNSATTKPLIYGNFAANQVGINTSSIPTGYTLAVDGKLIAEEVKVKMSNFWDDVFVEETYDLMSIEEKEAFTQENKHLPSFAPEAEIVAEGMEIGDGIANTVKELEEAYLYIYQLNNMMKAQQASTEDLQKSIQAVLDQNALLLKENSALQSQLNGLNK